MKYALLILAALALVGVAYADNCTQGWVCDGNYSAYQLVNCSLINATYCDYGCIGGVCSSPPQNCTAGWKCENSTTLNYQYADCSWGENPYSCEYGCNLTTNQCNPCPEMGICGSGNESICDGGWYTEWQTQYCTLINTTCCPYGCSNGECLGQNCTPGCSCVGNVRSCVNETCAITNTTCQYGCSNGACNPCEDKWICTDSTHKGHQLSNCSVTSVTSCPYGCLNGVCKSKPGPDPIQDSAKKKTTMAAAGVLGMGGSMDWVVVAILILLVVGVCYFFLMKKK